jgi:hypothetical protein
MKRDRPYRPTRIKTQLAGLTLIRDELGQREILRFMGLGADR